MAESSGDFSIPAVVFVADNHFALPLAAAIASLVDNFSGNALHIFIIDGGISAANRQKVEQSASARRADIRWLKPAEQHRAAVKSLPWGYVGRSTYWKLFIPELLGPNYPKVLYLDSDVIVAADAGDLWNQEPGENFVLAAQDLINPFVSSPFGLRNWRELGFKSDDELFNTGVLVINARKWLETGILKTLLRYLKEHSMHVRLCDQDAMNAVFRGAWRRLDSRWNVLQYMRMAQRYSLLSKTSHMELLRHAYIIHYCGPVKPWNTKPYLDSGRLFYTYLDRTGWAGWRPGPLSILKRYGLAYYARRALSLAKRGWSRLLESLRSFTQNEARAAKN